MGIVRAFGCPHGEVSPHLCYNITMGKLTTKFRKGIYWLKHDLLIFDNVIIIIAATFCLAWTWGSIAAMTRNWSLSQEVLEYQREKSLLELEVEMLELENEYYRSNEYQELAARKYQNKKLPGEVMVYLPANSDAARAKHQSSATQEVISETEERTNFQQWIAFLFGV